MSERKKATHRAHVRTTYSNETITVWLKEEKAHWVSSNGDKWPKGSQSFVCTHCGSSYEGNPITDGDRELLLDTIRPVTFEERKELYVSDVKRAQHELEQEKKSLEFAEQRLAGHKFALRIAEEALQTYIAMEGNKE